MGKAPGSLAGNFAVGGSGERSTSLVKFDQRETVEKLKLLFALLKINSRISLTDQWLRLHAANAGCVSSTSDWGTMIPHAVRCSQKIKTNYIKV